MEELEILKREEENILAAQEIKILHKEKKDLLSEATKYFFGKDINQFKIRNVSMSFGNFGYNIIGSNVNFSIFYNKRKKYFSITFRIVEENKKILNRILYPFHLNKKDLREEIYFLENNICPKIENLLKLIKNQDEKLKYFVQKMDFNSTKISNNHKKIIKNRTNNKKVEYSKCIKNLSILFGNYKKEDYSYCLENYKNNVLFDNLIHITVFNINQNGIKFETKKIKLDLEKRKLERRIESFHNESNFILNNNTFLSFEDFKNKYQISSKYIKMNRINIPFEDINKVFKIYILQNKLQNF